ncbi:MAG: phage integrase [Gammaproteobacteria bacterium]|jgi:hypothetical protein|nr:phage integrase [Gammaproteobacteria bacterium]
MVLKSRRPSAQRQLGVTRSAVQPEQSRVCASLANNSGLRLFAFRRPTNVYAEIDLEMKANALAKCEVHPSGKSHGRWHQPALMEFLRSL